MVGGKGERLVARGSDWWGVTGGDGELLVLRGSVWWRGGVIGGEGE